MNKSVDDYIDELMRYDQIRQNPNPINKERGSGTLVVIVTNSRGLYPVANATVTVSGSGSDKITEVKTDVSGRTESIQLDAPSYEYSETPQDTKAVASYYDIVVSSNGFVNSYINNIPIFDGVESIQRVDMLYESAAPKNQPQIINLPENPVI